MKTDRGFTLIEVIVAIALFTITMVYGLSFFIYGSRSALRAEVRREALQKCNDLIEKHKGDFAISYNPSAVYAGPGGLASITEYVGSYKHPLMSSVADVSCRVIETTATWKGTSNGLVHLMTIKAPQFPAYVN